MKLSETDLIREIKRRGPWYQRIEFPSYGITTTDDLDDIWLDHAPDNRIDGLNAQQACQLRPAPKWKYIEPVLPVMTGLEVLEVGSNNGFFSFKFAELGAKRVVGIDHNRKWINQAQWANSVLGFNQVSFLNCDFYLLKNNDLYQSEMLKTEIKELPLPHAQFDLVFSSSVINHMFFPFLAIFKMLWLSRMYVIIDFPVPIDKDKEDITMYIHPSGNHHSFHFSEKLLLKMIKRMGIDVNDIKTYRYNENKLMTMVIKTVNFSGSVF